MDLALNNLQRSIRHKTKQTKPEMTGNNVTIAFKVVFIQISRDFYLFLTISDLGQILSLAVVFLTELFCIWIGTFCLGLECTICTHENSMVLLQNIWDEIYWWKDLFKLYKIWYFLKKKIRKIRCINSWWF